MSWSINPPLIAILRGIRPEEVIGHVSVLLESGFTAIEIPTNSPDWQRSITSVVQQFGDTGLFGAGTVLRVEQVDELAATGGRLVVTPNTNPQVIRHAVQQGMLVCAGCATASEAFSALDNGAQILKIFPSSAFGPAYITALKAVLPANIPVLAVGGVTPDNLSLWLQAGCSGAGPGNDLYRAGQPIEQTRVRAEAFISAYQQCL